MPTDMNNYCPYCGEKMDEEEVVPKHICGRIFCCLECFRGDKNEAKM